MTAGPSAPLAPDAPATCPVCDAVLAPEWGNVNRIPRWRFPDHPIADNGYPQCDGYRCIESRRAITVAQQRRAARMAPRQAVAA